MVATNPLGSSDTGGVKTILQATLAYSGLDAALPLSISNQRAK